MAEIPSARFRERLKLYMQDQAQRRVEELEREYYHNKFWPGDIVRHKDGRMAAIVCRHVAYLCDLEDGTQVLWEETDLRK